MMALVWSFAAFLVISTFVPDVALQETRESDYESLLNEISDVFPHITDKEYVKKMQSLIDSYRQGQADKNERMVIETNALINTKYRTWKRNADLINSLLALPKGMNDAGR